MVLRNNLKVGRQWRFEVLLVLIVDLISSLGMLRVDRLEVVVQLLLLLLLGLLRRPAAILILVVHRHDAFELHLRLDRVESSVISSFLLDSRVAGIPILLKATVLLIDESLVDNGCDLLLLSTALRLAAPRPNADCTTYHTVLFLERLEDLLRLAVLKIAAQNCK